MSTHDTLWIIGHSQESSMDIRFHIVIWLLAITHSSKNSHIIYTDDLALINASGLYSYVRNTKLIFLLMPSDTLIWLMLQPMFWQPVYRMAPRNQPHHPYTPNPTTSHPYPHHPYPLTPTTWPPPSPLTPTTPDPHPYPLTPTTPRQSFVHSFGHYSMGRTT